MSKEQGDGKGGMDGWHTALWEQEGQRNGAERRQRGAGGCFEGCMEVKELTQVPLAMPHPAFLQCGKK